MYIDATEEFIFNYEYFPEELNGWRYYNLFEPDSYIIETEYKDN